MSRESLDIADKIIMDAYLNGMSIRSVGDNKVVKHRLRLFGEWIDGAYYLNERGFDYASKGCLKGIQEKQAKDNYIYDLNIKSIQKAINDADRAFIHAEKSLAESKVNNRIALAAVFVSIASLLLPLILPVLAKLLNKIAQL